MSIGEYLNQQIFLTPIDNFYNYKLKLNDYEIHSQSPFKNVPHITSLFEDEEFIEPIKITKLINTENLEITREEADSKLQLLMASFSLIEEDSEFN